MSVLTQAIQPQRFELIRDRIGEILADEINHQYFLTYNYHIDADVWVERWVDFDTAELPAINVSFAGGPYQDQNAKDTKGVYTYYIDVYTKAPTTNATPGDSLSTYRLHRLLGICRSILDNPLYNNLGYVKPFIDTVHVKEIGIKNPRVLVQDALSTMMGRLSLEVRVIETTELKTPVLIYEYITQVKLGLTDKGYLFSAQSLPVDPIDATIITAQSQLVVG